MLNVAFNISIAIATNPVSSAAEWERFVYGRSVEGRDLEAWETGYGSQTILILGGIHGDERNPVPFVQKWRFQAISRKDQHLIFIECANPDGQWNHTRVNAHGVDLNRNFDADWSTEARAPRYFPGISPLSEPESVALHELIKRVKPTRMMSVHSPIGCVNFDGPDCLELATEMSLACGMPIKSDIGYPTPGSLGRLSESLGIPLITLELTSEDFPACWKRYQGAIDVFMNFR